MLGELLCGIIQTALGYNCNCVFIDAGCSIGIIPNTVSFVHHTISYSNKILPKELKVTITTAFE